MAIKVKVEEGAKVRINGFGNLRLLTFSEALKLRNELEAIIPSHLRFGKSKAARQPKGN